MSNSPTFSIFKRGNSTKNEIGDNYLLPQTLYFKTKESFNKAVAKDFIRQANLVTDKGEEFFVGLAHGQSPSGAYAYILDHYYRINCPEKIVYTFTNSKLKSQRDLQAITEARIFIRRLMRDGKVTKDRVFGADFNYENHEEYAENYNAIVNEYLTSRKKDGFDYVFLASNSIGRVAGISRDSTAFKSTRILEIVKIKEANEEEELTVTPFFLLRSKRIAFLATKADKRRPLAWLYSKWGKANESPSFLRYIDGVEKKMTVFVDDEALTWPQITIKRLTQYGESIIRIDTGIRYNENAVKKKPVILFIHGFLGLNSFDGLLTSIPSHKYISAAMHYGTIPDELPPEQYSQHVAKNINEVVNYFGSKGHAVYIFDHSMGNIYFLMMNRDIDQYPAIKKYLKGRIGANPFFGEQVKHAVLGFLDYVIIPSASFLKSPAEKTILLGARRVIPLDTKTGVRIRGIRLTKRLITNDSLSKNGTWEAVKNRILELMSNLDSLPALNRIPIQKALNGLPVKIFAIQLYSALQESKSFDNQKGLASMELHQIPVLIIKSERDCVAKYVSHIYESSFVDVMDVTDPKEKNLFREHLFHMVYPLETAKIIDEFINKIESN